MNMAAPRNPTWREMAPVLPEFVQWVVQKYGPRHENPVTEEEYNRYKALYEAASNAD